MRHRALAAALLSCCTATATARGGDDARADQPPAKPTTNVATPLPSADAIAEAFSALVMLGDKARQQGRIGDAITAYQSALALRDDPAVVGRLGLLYALAGAPEMATRNLLVALERGGGTPNEKDEFFRGFKQNRPLVYLLHVIGNVFDAEVSIDGSAFRKEMGPTFKLFVMPGKHMIRGKAPSGDEAVVEQDCPKGGEETAVLKWNLPARVEEAPSKAEVAVLLPQPRIPPAKLLGEKIEGDSMADAVDDKETERAPIVGGVIGEQKKQNPRGVVGLGPVAVLGVASWVPAVGVGAFGSFYANEYISFDLDGRIAWLTTGVAGDPDISAMTVGGLMSFCGHWRWAFGCFTGHLGIINIDFSGGYTKRSFSFSQPGLGGRVGARIPLAGAFALQLSADVVGLGSGVRVGVENVLLVDQAPVLIGVNTGLAWVF